MEVCVCVCVERGYRLEGDKARQQQRRAAYFNLIRLVSLADAELALCQKGVCALNGGDLEWIGRRRGDKVQQPHGSLIAGSMTAVNGEQGTA